MIFKIPLQTTQKPSLATLLLLLILLHRGLELGKRGESRDLEETTFLGESRNSLVESIRDLLVDRGSERRVGRGQFGGNGLSKIAGELLLLLERLLDLGRDGSDAKDR